jgi:leucyl aminopeptidase (aminopeptidase T)
LISKKELRKIAKRILKFSSEVKKSDRVCIIADTNKRSIGEALLEASKSLGAESVMILMSPTGMHGNEPSQIVAGAMKHATVVYTVVTYAMTHTNAFKESLQAGSRAIVMRGINEEMMVNGAIRANYVKVHKRSERLASVLRASSKVKLISDQRTEFTFEIGGRPVFVLGGIAKTPGTFAAMPDGEVALSPVEGTANGRIVFDYSVDGVGKLKKPLRLDVINGRVEGISGSSDAKVLKRLIGDAGDCGRNIAEFALGTNPRARLIGNLAEDKKKEGTVHIAIGDNHLLGGSVDCEIHLDGLVTKPTVILDDSRKIIEEGKIIWQNITN